MKKFNYGDAVTYQGKTYYYIHTNKNTAYCWSEFTVDTVSGEIIIIPLNDISINIEQLEVVDLTALRNLAREYINDRISWNWEVDEDYPVWFEENVLQTLYWDDIFDRIKQY